MSACELRYHNINMVIKRNTRVIKGEIMKIDSTMDIFWFTQRGEGSFDCKVFFIETVWIEGDSTWSHKGRYHDDTHRNWILRHLMKFWVVWARSVFHGVDKKWMRSVWLLLHGSHLWHLDRAFDEMDEHLSLHCLSVIDEQPVLC